MCIEIVKIKTFDDKTHLVRYILSNQTNGVFFCSTRNHSLDHFQYKH